MEIYVDIIPHNKHINLSTRLYGDLIKQTYIGYSLKEAKADFRDYVKEEKKKYIIEKRK